MRVTALIVALAIGLSGSIAFAEKVKTNQEAKLLNHPGEQGAVLLHLKEGQTMTLLSEDGRWLKVRVQGRTGFIPRSKVDMPDKDEIARNTRRRPFVDGRGTKRGFGGGEGPDDRIGADATGTSGASDGDDDTKKPAAKKTAKSGDDDDDDDAKKPAAKKPAVKKAAAKKSGDDDDDDDDAKKPAAKKPAVKKAAAKKSGDDDDDDDDAKKPAAKKPAVKKAAAKKSGDDDDDDDDAKKPAAKKPAAKKVAAKGDDDDDDDAKKPAAKKSGDDDTAGDDDNADKRPKAHVGAKTKVFDERNKTSSVSFVAKPDEVLYTGETKGDWTMVENSEGDAGWALTSGLDVDGESGPDTRSKSIDLTARVGVTFIQQGMRTAGSTKTTGDMVPDAYNIGASAATVAIGGGLLVPYGKKAYLGGELTYDGSKTVGGGIYYMMVKTGFTIHDINARALAAYDFHRPSGMMLVGHLGFRYRAYLVDGYASATTNPARIPQETLKAPTIGVALAMPTFSEKIGMQFGLDTILFGSSIDQTAGLEDGSTPSMKDFELSAHLVYRWKKDMNLEASYDLDYGSYDFGMPPADSTRGHTGTDVTRTDILHMVTFGIIKGF